MNTKTQDDARARLRRIAGQITGIQRMLDEDRYCVDVLIQVSAAQAALGETAKVILGGHVASCLADALRTGSEGEQRQKIRELVDLFSRFCGLGDPSGTRQGPEPHRGEAP